MGELHQEQIPASPVESSAHSDLISSHELSPTISRASVTESGTSSMIDASDFRVAMPEPSYQTLNGRMSPGYSSATSYATLTPMQPLPPISTMSDKFISHYGHPGNVSGSFTLMQNNGLGVGMGMNAYQYEKLTAMAPMNMSPPHYGHGSNGLGLVSQQHSPMSPHSVSSYSQNGLHSPTKSISPNEFESYTRGLGQPQSPPIPVTLHSPMHSPNPMGSMPTLNGLHTPHTPPSAHMQPSGPSPPPPTTLGEPAIANMSSSAVVPTVSLTLPTTSHMVTSIDPIITSSPQSAIVVTTARMVSSTPQLLHNNLQQSTIQQQSSQSVVQVNSAGSSNSSNAGEVEEINTKELAQRISAELKRYSIPQAIFAQRVLCRSQGTLSDLLRNPKPWSKLKSGRETFRRMWKWLQEPEFQRMSALRLAGAGPPSQEPHPYPHPQGKMNLPPYQAMSCNSINKYQMRNVNQRAVSKTFTKKRQHPRSTSCFIRCSLQEERRMSADQPRATNSCAQETSPGLYGFATAYTPSYI